MNENISRIVADLFAKAKRGEGVSSEIQRLHAEIKNAIEHEDTMFGKIRGLEESFREIIPDERHRFNAAIKALSTTLKLSRQEIVQAVHQQLEELKIIEKVLMPAIPGWREEVMSMAAKVQGVRSEIIKLRERIAILETQETEMQNNMAAREKELEVVEKAMKDLFANIGAEITLIKDKVETAGEAYQARPYPPQPIPQQVVPQQPVPQQPIPQQVVPQQPIPQQVVPQQPVPQQPTPQQGVPQQPVAPDLSSIPIGKTESSEQKSEPAAPVEEPDTEWQKKCPMCGGRMNLHTNEGIWLCYSCAYEEKTDQVPPAKEEKRQTAKPEEQREYSRPAESPRSSAVPSLDHILPDEGPLSSLPSDDFDESPRESHPEEPTKKKNCPVCRKKMMFYPKDKAWRCPNCQYERRI